jgi:hypothetical protein
MTLIYILFLMPGWHEVYSTSESGRCKAIAAQLGSAYRCETMVKP